jgi:hypothetical protein
MLLLKHQPDNPYDENAIAILTQCGVMLGHVPRRLASLLVHQLHETVAVIEGINPEDPPWNCLQVALFFVGS